MSSHSIGHLGRVLAKLSATAALLCAFGTLAVAQEPTCSQVGALRRIFILVSRRGRARCPSDRIGSGDQPLGFKSARSWCLPSPMTSLGISASLVDASDHWGISEKGIPGACCRDADFVHPLHRSKVHVSQHSHFSPFLEVLGGDQRLYPEGFHHIDKLGLMAGGGLDINLTRHFAFRLIRADFVMSSYRYGPSASTPMHRSRGRTTAGGIVFMFGGGAPPVPPSAACSVQPSEVFAGEPVTATASGSNFNPKRTVKYDWSGTGVKSFRQQRFHPG